MQVVLQCSRVNAPALTRGLRLSNPDGRAVHAAGQKRMEALLTEQLNEIRKLPDTTERKAAIASLRMREWVCLRGTFPLVMQTAEREAAKLCC